MKSIHKTFAFTLAEMLICLSVVSVMATVLIPTISTYRPNKNKTLFKKAYQVAENVVVDLINDNSMYFSGEETVGFDNVSQVVANLGRIRAHADDTDSIITVDNDTKSTYVGDSSSSSSNKAKGKFCILFASKLNVMTDAASCSTPNDGNPDYGDGPTFMTTDGVTWYMPVTNFTDKDAGRDNLAWKIIKVDVNGDEGPNVEDNEAADVVCNSEVDRFNIYVRVDGKMRVKGVCAREYMQEVNLSSTKSSGKANSALANSNSDTIDIVEDGDGHTIE